MTRTSVKTSLFFISLALNLPIVRGICAQQPNQEEPIRLKAELVEIDVVVVDKNNRPVTDLKKEDFLLFEDGQPQQISFFSLVRPLAPEKKALGQASPQPENFEPGRFIFIILDQAHISRDNYTRLRESLLRFITEDLSPQDYLAVIGTSGGMAVFQQATRNKQVMALAINAFLGGRLDYSNAGPQTTDFTVSNYNLQSELDRVLKEYNGRLRLDQMFIEYELREGLRSLRSIARNLSKLPGRKIAIFVSEYLPTWLSTKYQTQDSHNFDNVSQELKEIIGISRRGGVVFYALDPRALEAPHRADRVQGRSALDTMKRSSGEEDDGSGDLLWSRAGLKQLAQMTGGFTIFNNNDLRAGLQKVLADNEAYYVLGYYPTNAARDGKFRRVKVMVKDRPDLIVRVREGYLAPSEKEEKKSKSKQDLIRDALSSLVPIREVKVGISQMWVEKARGGNSLKVATRLDASTLQFKEKGGKHFGSFEIIVLAYDIVGKLAGGFSKTFNLNFKPETYAAALLEGMNVNGQVELKGKGLYSIRVIVIDRESLALGTDSQWIEVK